MLFAKDQSMAVLKAMLQVETDDAEETSKIMFHLKHWLDVNSEEIKGQIGQIENRGKKPWESLDGSAGLLRDSVLGMQKLIGVKAAFMDQMSAYSVEKMIEMAIGETNVLVGLGEAYVDLDSKLTTWNKLSISEVGEDIKQLVAEAELLARAAKLCLACQSGSLSALLL